MGSEIQKSISLAHDREANYLTVRLLHVVGTGSRRGHTELRRGYTELSRDKLYQNLLLV